MKKTTTIAFDVDGVILNFLQSFTKYIEKTYQVQSKIPYSTKQFGLDVKFGEEYKSYDKFLELKDQFTKEQLWDSIEPMPDIEKIHELLKRTDIDFFFVTHVEQAIHKARLINLSNILKVEIKPEQLICVDLGDSKKPAIEKIKPHYFVEDNLHNLKDCHIDNAHKSLWIDLEEAIYKPEDIEHGQNSYKIQAFKNLNSVVDYIIENLDQKKNLQTN